MESFLQEWLWFGALHDFELACGVEMNPEIFIQLGLTNPNCVLNTEPLLPYVKSVVIDRLVKEGVPLDLNVGEHVYVEQRQALHAETLKYRPFRISAVLGEMKYTYKFMLLVSLLKYI